MSKLEEAEITAVLILALALGCAAPVTAPNPYKASYDERDELLRTGLNPYLLYARHGTPWDEGYEAIIMSASGKTHHDLVVSLDWAAHLPNPFWRKVHALTEKARLWRVTVHDSVGGHLLTHSHWRSTLIRAVTMEKLPTEQYVLLSIDTCDRDSQRACEGEDPMETGLTGVAVGVFLHYEDHHRKETH